MTEMAAFDFIDSSVKGYRFVADHRKVVLGLALVPFAIKLVSFLGVTMLDMNENYLRQGLLLLPSYFAEGWLVAHVTRLAIFKEALPAKTEAEKPAGLHTHDVLAAAIIYVLIKLILSVTSGLVLMGSELPAPAQQPQATAGTFMIGVAALAIMIYAFRFLWIYVPVAMGYSLADFLFRIKSYTTSFYMVGTWLLCFVPLALMMVMTAGLLDILFPGGESEPSTMYTYCMVVVQAVLEMAISVVASLGMAYGIHSIYQGTNRDSFGL